MNPVRRELLNGLLVLVVASLLSVAFSAFQVSFNPLLWVLVLMAIAIAVSGYILFEITLGVITSAEDRERALAESTRQREEEWLKRVGTPARMELSQEGQEDRDAGMEGVIEQVRSLKPGSDLTTMFHATQPAPLGSHQQPLTDLLTRLSATEAGLSTQKRSAGWRTMVSTNRKLSDA